MVVKTELCSFSETRIYPGHGVRFIRRDGQPVTLSGSKCRHMLNQRKKPAKLVWTQAWRRLNKKIRDDNATKKKSRKTVKVQRAIVGATLDDLRLKKQAPKKVDAATAAALKEVKDRKKAAANKAQQVRSAGAAVPKNQKDNTGR